MKQCVLLSAVFGALLSASVLAATDSREVVAVQLCAINAPAKLTSVQVVTEGWVNSVGGVTFDMDGRTPLTEAWESSSMTGQRVGSYWGSINKYGTPTFVIVENYVLPLKATEVPTDKWTGWKAPQFAVKDGSRFAIMQVNNQKPQLESINGDDTNFRFRFKRMSFDTYLSNMPRQDGPKTAWSDDPIPACQQGVQ